ncbi:MAG TPA: cell surface protein, partial [Opitutaceae bacterium]
MQNNPLSHARRICLWLVALLGLSLLTGCDEVKITNLTPGSLPENPSQIYTLTARFSPKASGIVAGSLRPSVVIDGKIHPMKASPLGQDIYEFDYQIPAGRTELAYYYLVNFKVEYSGTVSEREAYIGLQNARIV